MFSNIFTVIITDKEVSDIPLSSPTDVLLTPNSITPSLLLSVLWKEALSAPQQHERETPLKTITSHMSHHAIHHILTVKNFHVLLAIQ